LSDVRQESLFPDLELSAAESDAQHSFETATETATEAMFAPVPGASPWRVGDDITHRDYGHGWVQGAGHGVVTVRFETRSSGPGQARTFPAETADVVSANPIDSLDWPDFVGALRTEESAVTSAPPADDVGNG
jgi:DNA polymerase-4